MTTHIICKSYTLSDYDEYKKYSNVHIVNQNFLLVSLKYKSKALEENFEVKQIEDTLPEINSLQKKMSSFSNFTQMPGQDSGKTQKFKIEGVGFSFT